MVKFRNGFVSNSSSSSFIIYNYDENDELRSYEIIVGNMMKDDDEELEIFSSIANELGKRPNQNDEMEIIHTEIPKTWEKYEFKMQKYLQMKIPLDFSFNNILEIIKKYKEKENED